MNPVIWRDALGQAEAIRTGEVSAVELLQTYLTRIGTFNERLRAYAAVDEAGAMRAAAAVDAQRRHDPALLPLFAGVPLSIKDTDDVAGLPTTQSCEVLAEHVATRDSPIVSLLRSSGAIIVGKSHIPEFCTTITNSRMYGSCRNPWDTERTAGGSSGGAASALAAGLCALSHGTDGAGSIRAPASWCGLVGVKPSRRLVSFGPDIDSPFYESSVHGVLVRSVRDAAAMLDVLAPPGPWTPSRTRSFTAEIQHAPQPLRVAVSTRYPVGVVEGEVVAAVEDAARLVESLGHRIHTADPAWGRVLAAAALPMSMPHIAKHVALEDVERLEPRNRPTLQYEASLNVLQYYRTVEAARVASREFLRFWDDIDVLLTPAVGMVAPSIDWAPWDQDTQAHRRSFSTLANFAHPFNITGQPALSLPLGWSKAGLPIGVQLAARHLGEATLLQLAAQIEAAAPWLERITAAGRRLEP